MKRAVHDTAHTPNPDYRSAVASIFERPGFITDVGITFIDCGPGWCTTRLLLLPRHLQHTGVVHAGVAATMADHTAGGAAATLLEAHQLLVTVEFKIHLLRAARGTHLECRGEVLKPGARFTIAESTVYAIDCDASVAVAKLIATLAQVDA